MDMDASCETAGTIIMAPGCCDNEFISIDIDDDYQLVSEGFSIEPTFLFAFTYTFLFDFQKSNEPGLAYADHHPPPLEQDYQSLYQSFLL